MNAAAARHRYVLVSGLTWLPIGLSVPVTVLLMEVRGLGVASAGLAFAVYGISVAAMELPTGGLADVIGRRTVLAASAVVTLTCVLWMAFATSLWQFLAISVLKGVARALSSGPAEAWYVDAVHAAGTPDGELRRGLSQGSAAGSVALAVGTLTGGGLPLVVPLPDDGVLVPLSVPLLVAAVAAAALMLVSLLGLSEPPRPTRTTPRELLRGVPATIGRGARLGYRDGVLTRVLLTSGALGVALNSIELLTPGRLAVLTGDAAAGSTAYSLVAAVGFGAVGAGSAISPWLAHRLGRTGANPAALTAAVGATVAAVSLAGLAASGGLTGAAGVVAAAVSYAGMFTGLGIAGPTRSELLHSRVESTERATVLSVDSLLLQAAGAVCAVGLGAMAAAWSPSAAWWVAAGTLLAGGALFLSRAVRHAATRPVTAASVPVAVDAGSTHP